MTRVVAPILKKSVEDHIRRAENELKSVAAELVNGRYAGADYALEAAITQIQKARETLVGEVTA